MSSASPLAASQPAFVAAPLLPGNPPLTHPLLPFSSTILTTDTTVEELSFDALFNAGILVSFRVRGVENDSAFLLASRHRGCPSPSPVADISASDTLTLTPFRCPLPPTKPTVEEISSRPLQRWPLCPFSCSLRGERFAFSRVEQHHPSAAPRPDTPLFPFCQQSLTPFPFYLFGLGDHR